MANYGKYYIAVRLLLLKQYLEANAGRDRIVKRGELEALLREHDMPVEKKTLYADFAALGDICGLQLDYDPHKKGYRLLNPPFEPYELRLLVDSVQSSKFITREKAQELTAKIKKFAGKDTVESLNRENHVANRIRNMNDSVMKDADRIHAAIAADRKINFRYFHYVRIRFRNELADAVIDQFGKDIMMMPCDENHFIILAPIEISPPFFAWIATFGRKVKILSPEPVVEKMREFLEKSLEMYKNDGEM